MQKRDLKFLTISTKTRSNERFDKNNIRHILTGKYVQKKKVLKYFVLYCKISRVPEIYFLHVIEAFNNIFYIIKIILY